MYSNIDDFYNIVCDEDERLSSQVGKIEYLTTMKYLEKLCPSKCKILDACAGTGIYAFQLAKLGYSVTASDLVAINVDKMTRRNRETPLLAGIYQDNILDLSRYENESFDVVLNLGAYYHINNEADRKKSIQESLRVLKKDGLFYMAYINKFANYIGHVEEMNDDFDVFEKFIENGTIDNVFFSVAPEIAEKDVREFGVDILYHLGTDGHLFHMRDVINAMSPNIFERYLNIHLSICENRSTIGYSEHALVVGRK